MLVGLHNVAVAGADSRGTEGRSWDVVTKASLCNWNSALFLSRARAHAHAHTASKLLNLITVYEPTDKIKMIVFVYPVQHGMSGNAVKKIPTILPQNYSLRISIGRVKHVTCTTYLERTLPLKMEHANPNCLQFGRSLKTCGVYLQHTITVK